MRHALLFLSFFCCIICKAQNLVPNPSFEEYTDCPVGIPDLEGKCVGWTSFKGSPDYFNNCSANVGFNNPVGYQSARTGNAYAGFLNYDIALANSTEQVGVELLNQLEIGVKYYISFYVACAYKPLITNIASNKIGVLFTAYRYSDPNLNFMLPNDCHLYNNSIISDTIGWTKISGTFVADSAYKYIVLGGFFDKTNIDTIIHPYLFLPRASYYYVDDICVSKDASLCGVAVDDCDFILPSAFSPNGDNVNDEFKWVYNCNKAEEFSMHIYNRWGVKIFESKNPQLGWNGKYNNEPQPTGVYAVVVSAIINGEHITKVASFNLIV